MTPLVSRSMTRLQRGLALAAGLLVVKVTAEVIYEYRHYLPPNFESDFLQGRAGYFFGHYQWAFYAHIVSGPVALLMGLVLLSEAFRRRFPHWHRRLGRWQVLNVLGVVVPSGLWMSGYAASGPMAGLGLAVLGLATAVCTALGWRFAVRRNFVAHRRWMWRSFLLLCSAVTLRVFGGAATVAGVTAVWFDPLATWASWLLPIGVFEVIERWRQADRRLLSGGMSRATGSSHADHADAVPPASG